MTMSQRRSSRVATSWRQRIRHDPIITSSSKLAGEKAPRLSPQLPPPTTTPESGTSDCQTPSLVCFLACHISQPHRIETLRWTLNSIAAQRVAPLPAASVRISYSASPAIADGVRAMLAEAAERNPSLAVHERPAQQSQFEHLRSLTREAAASPTPPQWVYFSDDDDLWSENRHTLFRDACRKYDATPSVHAVCCTRKARPEKKDDDAIDDAPSEGVDGGASYVTSVPDAAAARALVASGAARLTDLEAFDLSVESFNMDEYFDYAVRLPVLSSFFKLAPNALVRHKLCDLAFISSHVKVCTSYFLLINYYLLLPTSYRHRLHLVARQGQGHGHAPARGRRGRRLKVDPAVHAERPRRVRVLLHAAGECALRHERRQRARRGAGRGLHGSRGQRRGAPAGAAGSYLLLPTSCFLPPTSYFLPTWSTGWRCRVGRR